MFRHPLSLGAFIATIRADFYRYDGASSLSQLLRCYVMEPGARYTLWLRCCWWTRDRSLLRPIYAMFWSIRRHYEFKFGFSIPVSTSIGAGLYFSHFGGIVINGDCQIGRNCNIGHGVTIGQSNRGTSQGVPSIGDRVFIGPGAKIFGGITIGADAAIGANAVVTRDVPPSGVVVGAPCRLVSMNGSKGYIDWVPEDAAGRV
ncbi:MAG: serine O-acetyltransferase [Verrucomicrobiota bacterium]